MEEQRPKDVVLQYCGAQMKHARQEQAWTLSDVKRKTGVPVDTIRAVEKGDGGIAFETFLQIGEAVGLTPALLFPPAIATSLSRLSVAAMNMSPAVIDAFLGLINAIHDYKSQPHSTSDAAPTDHDG